MDSALRFAALVVVAIALLVGSLLLTAGFLFWGVRCAKIPQITFRRALVGSIGLGSVTIAMQISLVWLRTSMPEYDLALRITAWTVLVLLSGAAIAWLFTSRSLRTIRAWLLTLIPSFGFLILSPVILRLLATETYVIPTNGMAPTLVGVHWTGKCPRCGSLAYGSPHHPGDPRGEPPDGFDMICSQELRDCKVRNPDRTERSGDRIFVNKLAKPHRWDLVVFRYPGDPTTNYVKRLVGLPGEEVTIRDGAVCINGQKIEPPPELRGLKYVTEFDYLPPGQVLWLWGDEEHPAKLGPDEYFVLGDFSARSMDSRFWERGAPRHSPYAVPADHLVGVVTHIYWPPSRWRALR